MSYRKNVMRWIYFSRWILDDKMTLLFLSLINETEPKYSIGGNDHVKQII